MQNILRIIRKLTAFICCLLLILVVDSSYANAFPREECERQETPQRADSTLTSCAYDLYGNRIDLHYSSRQRRIWITSHRFSPRQYTVSRLEKGANPELVGADESIRILFRKTVVLEGREFLFFTTAQRTMRGDGGGNCGAGAEVQLNVYELSGRNIIRKSSLLIESCAIGMELQSENTGLPLGSSAIQLLDKDIQLRWFDYPKLNPPVIGEYQILEDKLVIRNAR